MENGHHAREWTISSRGAAQGFSAGSLQPKSRGIRVLSLFDGIATGFVVLQRLGVPIEAYYSCEIDQDAIRVAKMHFGDRICSLGDVRYLDSLKLKCIAPIDLVIGGSPCNDLSLVNRWRKGLNDPRGTGYLFYHYKRVLSTLKNVNGIPFFWLFENVRNMELEEQENITRHLGVQPVLIDARKFTAMKRERLFWGNLPDMALLESAPPTHSHSLQDFLVDNVNRKASGECLSTVTTNQASLRIISDVSSLPVVMNGEPDRMWITEVETVFGFPRSYTDLGNLNYDQRLKLLGKAWSVHVVEALLKFLVPLFHKKDATIFRRCEPVIERLEEDTEMIDE